MRFQNYTQVSLIVGLVLLAFASCGSKAKDPPPREDVEKLLREEADVLKHEGEQVDPSLGVDITWDIQAVEVREQTSEESRSWVGTIRFLIKSEHAEYDGSKATQTFEKEFDYVWDVESERWIIR
jgi:hypothetical protein